jgi:GNAT superfamily N-acetyltransferase
MVIRSAVPADALAVATVHVRAWQQGFKDLLPAEYLAKLQPAERAQRYTFGITDGSKPQTIVAVLDDEIVGFATTGLHHGEALLHALYVAPERWGSGVGRALIAEAKNDLRRTGQPEAFLWSMVGNTRADRFYTADGWVLVGEPKVEEVWGTPVHEQRYRRVL